MQQNEQTVLLLTIILTLIILLAIVIPFLLTIRNTLRLVKPDNQAMTPNQVWMVFVPIIGIFWSFTVVTSVANSLRDEFASRGISVKSSAPGKYVGLAFIICYLLSMFPSLSTILSIPTLILFITYWVQIYRYKQLLKEHVDLGSFHIEDFDKLK